MHNRLLKHLTYHGRTVQVARFTNCKLKLDQTPVILSAAHSSPPSPPPSSSPLTLPLSAAHSSSPTPSSLPPSPLSLPTPPPPPLYLPRSLPPFTIVSAPPPSSPTPPSCVVGGILLTLGYLYYEWANHYSHPEPLVID